MSWPPYGNYGPFGPWPQQWGPTTPIYIPPPNEKEDPITYVRRMKALMGDFEKEFKKEEKKDEKKPKAPTLTLGQTLACTILFGPVLGYMYLYALYGFIQHAQNLIK